MNKPRSDMPIESLLVDEELTTCQHCDTRTDFVAGGTKPGDERREDCPRCGQRYLVSDVEVE